MKQVSRTELPYKTLKRILVNNLGGQQISKESVEYIRNLLETQLQELCQKVIKKQQESNKLRKFHGLPLKRRFEVNLFLSVSERGILTPPVLDGCKEAESVNPTPLRYKADEEVI
jgi:hypothetical protein